MEKGKSLSEKETDNTLRALEVELGEPILYRATGRFLGAEGLGTVPLDSWGLIVLTPTRVVFRHFAQSHALFGRRDGEVRWEVSRDRFNSCAPVLQSFWTKIFSGTPDHVALFGTEIRLALETADDPKNFPGAWKTTDATDGQ